ncbi:FIG00470655: hypothetical protein [hydrothermal vent metagenome]|uniref:Uncharacterized protein n=1 Tax=hydrothermal vent metagenome TaxID=652676 RepID=A0A1W1D1K1_9ZZZZ
MQKMSVVEAAQYFGISKEAIHNRIRRGTLQSVVEDGVKYVLVDKEVAFQKQAQKKTIDEKYIRFLEEQNQFFQQKLEKLEEEIKILREQKEHLLIKEQEMIKKIYKERDEQLTQVLRSFGSQFLLHNTSVNDPLDVEIQEIKKKKKKKKKAKK